MDYIFNELSDNEVYCVQDARDILSNFVKTCIAVKRELQLDTLRIHENVRSLNNLLLCKNYSITRWLKDNEVSNDLQNRFRQIVTTPPLIKETELEELEIFNTSYYYYSDREAKGLGAAYLLKTLSLSFLSNPSWNINEINLTHNYIDESENLANEIVSAKHAATIENVFTHKKYFFDFRDSCLSKCVDIWNNREKLFQNLIFCGKTKKQLSSGLSSRYVHQIFERLNALNEYIETWENGDFIYQDFKSKFSVDCSPESECTMKKYGDQRLFPLYQGRSEYFTLHIKTGNLRFHFFPDSASRKAYIGYIGPHLDICT